MSAALAAVILAHDDPPMVRRLLGALSGVDLFLHCDRRAGDATVGQMLRDVHSDVRLVPRRRTSWASWSLVEAELAGLRMALDRSRAGHVMILSGHCYPLTSVAELEADLAAWRGLSRLRLVPLPAGVWDTPRHADGGMWRFRRRFVTFRDQTVFVGRFPLRTFRRPIPSQLRLYGSTQWKIYAREHARALLQAIDDSPELRRFWSTTLVPDESCAASVLSSPELVGEIPAQLRDDLPWYLDWGSGGGANHPAWLHAQDFSALAAASRAASRDPNACPIGDPDRDAYRKLFARKLASSETELLDRIDCELRT